MLATTAAWAHGYITPPASRNLLCKQGGNTACGAIQWEPQSLEGQAFAWQGTVRVAPLLPATIPLFAWLDQLRYPSNPSLL